jgi:shikimate kinase
MIPARPIRAIMLIGPRGCGKTTVGRALSERLGLRFVDLDDVARARLGASSVTEAWGRHGEAGWRRAEAEALEEELAEGKGGARVVMALGGGTPTIDSARRRMRQGQALGEALVVYLSCPVEELRRRLREGGRDRPSLTGADPVEEVQRVLGDREALYRAAADVVIDAGRGPVGRTVEAVAQALASRGVATSPGS